jgi:hypothetical protein
MKQLTNHSILCVLVYFILHSWAIKPVSALHQKAAEVALHSEARHGGTELPRTTDLGAGRTERVTVRRGHFHALARQLTS